MEPAIWKSRLEEVTERYKKVADVELFDELVTEEQPIEDWEAFRKWNSIFKDGCFRGHRLASWDLVSTFERATQRTVIAEDGDLRAVGVGNLNAEENEREVLLAFQRAAHNYFPDAPPFNAFLDWLSLMQHYGAPTRLIDWTQSPYVVMYFAMQGDSTEDSAIWAIDLDWLENRSEALLKQHDRNYIGKNVWNPSDYLNGRLLSAGNPDIVVPVRPTRFHGRMLSQQGLFLASMRHGVTMASGLLNMLVSTNFEERQVVSKVVVRRNLRIELLEELRRMNIHNASLFPGLDGFAKSLAVNLEIDVAHQVEKRRAAMSEGLRVRRAFEESGCK